MVKRAARRAGGIAAGLGLGAVGGFVAALFRRRPPTPYRSSLQQPQPRSDQHAAPNGRRS